MLSLRDNFGKVYDSLLQGVLNGLYVEALGDLLCVRVLCFTSSVGRRRSVGISNLHVLFRGISWNRNTLVFTF